ncbi:MAG: aminotransferase class V-fold PLP-dependent enzyme [Rhizobiaceae bacterium]
MEKIRIETPGVSHCTHLLASGSALMPQPVFDAIIDHTTLEANIGGYEAQYEKAEQLDSVYQSVANLIGAEPKEIALLENATAAWCQAFYALPFKPGDRILTCEAEYAANYVAFLQRAKRDGIVIDVIPNDETGAIDLAAMEAMIDERVALIAITWVPTNGGLVNPAAAVGKIAKQHDITYLLDACQAVGQMPVDVTELNCDFLSATGRKFLRGPRGTGFLFIRKNLIETLEPVMIDHFAAPWVATNRYELRNDARRFENWENSYALRAGLGVAANYAMSIGLEAIQVRAWGLADKLRERLGEIPGTQLCDIGSEQCAIVSFTIENLDPRDTVAKLRLQKINISASDPESTRLDAETRNLPTVLRAAPHYYNTSEELERLVMALHGIAKSA